MTSTILLNSSNYDPITGRMNYNFNGTQAIKNKEIAIQQFSFYNSFFNISKEGTASLAVSNQITVLFPSFTGANVYTMVARTLDLPSGFYTYTDLNNAIQNFCILNGLYMVDPTTGLNIYFIDISVNSPVYRIELDLYYIPTATQATALGYTTGGMVLNTGNLAVTPQMTLTSTSPLSVLGFVPGTYPITPMTSTAATYVGTPATEILGSFPPQENQITALTLRCNLISNPISYPTDLIGQSPITAQFGAIDNFSPSVPCYMAIVDGMYQNFQITFSDQNQNQLTLQDPEITLALTLRERR